MSTYIGGTVGLDVVIDGRLRLTRIEYQQEPDSDRVTLAAVDGWNLEPFHTHHQTVTLTEFEARPRDAYDKTVETIWALRKLGLKPAGLAE